MRTTYRYTIPAKTVLDDERVAILASMMEVTNPNSPPALLSMYTTPHSESDSVDISERVPKSFGSTPFSRSKDTDLTITSSFLYDSIDKILHLTSFSGCDEPIFTNPISIAQLTKFAEWSNTVIKITSSIDLKLDVHTRGTSAEWLLVEEIKTIDYSKMLTDLEISGIITTRLPSGGSQILSDDDRFFKFVPITEYCLPLNIGLGKILISHPEKLGIPPDPSRGSLDDDLDLSIGLISDLREKEWSAACLGTTLGVDISDHIADLWSSL